MPEEILDYLGVGASFQKDRGRCVPKVVNSDLGQAGAI